MAPRIAVDLTVLRESRDLRLLTIGQALEAAGAACRARCSPCSR